MIGIYDVFFSYRREDLNRAQPLLTALDRAGLRVWRDQTDLPDGGAITDGIREALASSKALVAFYSAKYNLSRPCQQEITTAWIAAQQMGEAPHRRVLVVNPEDAFSHLPKPICDLHSMGWAGDATQFAALAAKVRCHVNDLSGTLLAARSPVTPLYFGMAPVQASRFVGRIREMWELHGQLTANRISIITGVWGQAATQVRGLGGNGKTLLAREYAIRFGSAYPGGVFWLRAYGNDDSVGPMDSRARENLRQTQIRDFAVGIGIHAEGRNLREVEAAFWQELAHNGRPCLWIVDDLPSGSGSHDIETRWNAQWTGASTLVTTRSTEYTGVGKHLDLGVLTADEARQLLMSHRDPEDDDERHAAEQIMCELGCHPLALEVAGAYLSKETQSFRHYLRDLRSSERHAVEWGAELNESLPTGHERSIRGTLLKSIRLLGREGLDFLRLASLLSVAPISVDLARDVFSLGRPGVPGWRVKSGVRRSMSPPTLFESLSELSRSQIPILRQFSRGVLARTHQLFARAQTIDNVRLMRALDQVESLGLCSKPAAGSRIVHTLVSRAVREHTVHKKRTARLKIAVVLALSVRLKLATESRQHAIIDSDIVHAKHLLLAGIHTREEAVLARWVGEYEYTRGDFVGARRIQEAAVQVLESLLGKQDSETLTAVDRFAMTLTAQGELANARTLQEELLRTRRRRHGSKHMGTISAASGLALTLAKLGDLQRARELQEEALEVLGWPNNDHPATLTVANAFAQTLGRQGHLAEARRVQERILEARERRLGKEDSETLTTASDLAWTVRDQGELAEARRLFEQVLEARMRLQGREHPYTCVAAWGLLLTLCDSGDLGSANRVLMGNLHWLLGRPPETLSADQKMMRERIPNLFG